MQWRWRRSTLAWRSCETHRSRTPPRGRSRKLVPKKEWLSMVAAHSDAWLLSVAFYLGAQFGFNKNYRSRKSSQERGGQRVLTPHRQDVVDNFGFLVILFMKWVIRVEMIPSYLYEDFPSKEWFEQCCD
uniref:PHD finger protein ALFIN-LIKE n=1 Tax=Zea mays TaxID=4577 RepID=A0A804MNF7_MAIZE